MGNKPSHIMTSDPRGLALVIHNKIFAESAQIRLDSKCDYAVMTQLFQQLKYQVVSARDVDSRQFKEIISDFKADLLDQPVDSCIVCVMSKVSRSGNSLLMADGAAIDCGTDLISEFDSERFPEFRHKLKLFIIIQTSGPTLGFTSDIRIQIYEWLRSDTLARIPRIENAVLHVSRLRDISPIYKLLSYTPGKLPQLQGSWFIKCLADVISKEASQTDVESLFNRIIPEAIEIEASLQDPVSRRHHIHSRCEIQRLRKKFYFNVESLFTQLIEIQNLVLGDSAARRVLSLVVDHLVISAATATEIKFILARHPHEALMQALTVWASYGDLKPDFLQALHRCGLSQLVSTMRVNPNLTSLLARKDRGTFMFTEPVATFVGRQQELQTLHKMLMDAYNPRSSIANIVTVCGLPGVGKSELVRKYAWDFRELFDGNILWVGGLADRVPPKLLAPKPDEAKWIPEFWQVLNENIGRKLSKIENESCLLILDNVDDWEQLKNYQPILRKRGKVIPHVLVTTRRCDVSPLPRNRLRLEGLDMASAIPLFDRGLKIASAIGAKEMAKTFHGSPYALHQAIAQINRDDSDVNNSDILQQPLSGLFLSGALPELDSHFTNAIAKAREADKNGEVCTQLLDYLECEVKPDIGITLKSLQALMGEEVRPCLNVLNRYCIVSLDDDGNVQVNPSFQHFLALGMGSANKMPMEKRIETVPNTSAMAGSKHVPKIWLGLHDGEETATKESQTTLLGRGFCPKSLAVMGPNVLLKRQTKVERVSKAPRAIADCVEVRNITGGELCTSIMYFDGKEEYDNHIAEGLHLETYDKLVCNAEVSDCWEWGPSAHFRVVEILVVLRLAQLVILDIENHLPVGLKAELLDLPYADYSEEHRALLWQFLKKNGSHLVSGVYIGGSLKIRGRCNDPSFPTISFHQSNVELKAAMRGALETQFDAEAVTNILNSLATTLTATTYTFQGGHMTNVKSSSDLTPTAFKSWLYSVEQFPAELIHGISLVPYYDLRFRRNLLFMRATLEYLQERPPER